MMTLFVAVMQGVFVSMVAAAVTEAGIYHGARFCYVREWTRWNPMRGRSRQLFRCLDGSTMSWTTCLIWAIAFAQLTPKLAYLHFAGSI